MKYRSPLQRTPVFIEKIGAAGRDSDWIHFPGRAGRQFDGADKCPLTPIGMEIQMKLTV